MRAETSRVTIRLARPADMTAVCAIVNHYIRTTAANFRTEPQQPHEWVEQWRAGHERYPWLVAEADGEVLGVAYAERWSARPAYDWCASTTVYVHHRARGKGVGQALYGRLLQILGEQGYRSALAGIALPNPASVRLHERSGFSHVGTITAAGFKMGGWHDVGFWQLRFASDERSPTPVGPVDAVALGQAAS